MNVRRTQRTAAEIEKAKLSKDRRKYVPTSMAIEKAKLDALEKNKFEAILHSDQKAAIKYENDWYRDEGGGFFQEELAEKVVKDYVSALALPSLDIIAAVTSRYNDIALLLVTVPAHQNKTALVDVLVRDPKLIHKIEEEIKCIKNKINQVKLNFKKIDQDALTYKKLSSSELIEKYKKKLTQQTDQKEIKKINDRIKFCITNAKKIDTSVLNYKIPSSRDIIKLLKNAKKKLDGLILVCRNQGSIDQINDFHHTIPSHVLLSSSEIFDLQKPDDIKNTPFWRILIDNNLFSKVGNSINIKPSGKVWLETIATKVSSKFFEQESFEMKHLSGIFLACGKEYQGIDELTAYAIAKEWWRDSEALERLLVELIRHFKKISESKIHLTHAVLDCINSGYAQWTQGETKRLNQYQKINRAIASVRYISEAYTEIRHPKKKQ